MGVGPTSQAWEAHILADVLRPQNQLERVGCFYSWMFGGVTIGPKIVFVVKFVITFDT